MGELSVVICSSLDVGTNCVNPPGLFPVFHRSLINRFARAFVNVS